MCITYWLTNDVHKVFLVNYSVLLWLEATSDSATYNRAWAARFACRSAGRIQWHVTAFVQHRQHATDRWVLVRRRWTTLLRQRVRPGNRVERTVAGFHADWENYCRSPFILVQYFSSVSQYGEGGVTDPPNFQRLFSFHASMNFLWLIR